MAEAKGWLGYTMTGPGGPYTVLPERFVFHEEPVWITPLAEGDPKPGDRMLWNDREVEVVSPVFEGGHWIAVARVEGEKHLHIAAVADLSPIPRTRSVTVELTEEEVDSVRLVAGGPVSPVIAKIAAALEDSP